MTLAIFSSLLCDHFTMDEMQKLIDFGREGYEDIHEDEEMDDDMEIIYEFVHDYLLDAAYGLDNFNEAVSSIIGRMLNAEEYEQLEKDMDARWLAKKGRKINIDIQKFKEQFDKEYQFLYDNHDRVVGYDEALAASESFMAEYGAFVGEFARYRGDFITSDREMVAFMFALNEMIGTEEEQNDAGNVD